VPFAEVSSVAFSTSTDGFALVITSAGTYVARTEDQGRHWVLASSAALYGRSMPATDAVGAIGTGLGGTVYAFPAGTAGAVVDVSNDSGSHWTRAHFPGTVADVVADGSSLWALVDGPPPQRSAVPLAATSGLALCLDQRREDMGSSLSPSPRLRAVRSALGTGSLGRLRPVTR
jgi:hypothetical protein